MIQNDEKASPYFELSISATVLKVHYLSETETMDEHVLQGENFAVAWIEKVNRSAMHYFWFKRGGHSYVLSACYKPRKGIQDIALKKVLKKNIGSKDVKNVNRWKNDVVSIAGNECLDDVCKYQRRLEEEGGAAVCLRVVQLTQTEAQKFIENAQYATLME